MVDISSTLKHRALMSTNGRLFWINMKLISVRPAEGMCIANQFTYLGMLFWLSVDGWMDNKGVYPTHLTPMLSVIHPLKATPPLILDQGGCIFWFALHISQTNSPWQNHVKHWNNNVIFGEYYVIMRKNISWF